LEGGVRLKGFLVVKEDDPLGLLFSSLSFGGFGGGGRSKGCFLQRRGGDGAWGMWMCDGKTATPTPYAAYINWVKNRDTRGIYRPLSSGGEGDSKIQGSWFHYMDCVVREGL